MKYTRIILLLVCGALTASSAAAQSSKKVVLPDYGRLPLSFEANEGQSNAHVKFLSRGRGYSLFLTGKEAVIALKKDAPQPPKAKNLHEFDLVRPQRPTARDGTVIGMQLFGANAARRVVGAEELPGMANYFIGNDPSKWRTNVPTYAKVKYEGIYPGVDLVYYGNQRQLEYDFVVAPGAEPRTIELKLRGAGKLRIDGNGDLVLGAAGEAVRFQKPVVYQTFDGERKTVEGSYILAASNRIAFRVGEYDHARPLVIDPIFLYSTYLGGSGDDQGIAVAVDSFGNAYVTGMTASTNFPTANPLPPALSGSNTGSSAFVTKINASGSAMIYSTYLGGGSDIGYGIAVDSAGYAYVTGSVRGSNFPTVNAFQPTYGGAGNAFVTKLNPSGSALAYSTYLGGTGGDAGYGIAVDSAGNAYMTGYTASTDFPTANALQPTLPGTSNTAYSAFVTKMNASGSGVIYSTYLGGGIDIGYGIAVDSAGNAYVTGDTASTNFPTANALQPALSVNPHNTHAFVTKMNASGSAFVYSTYLGGDALDVGFGIAADSSGNAYVTGYTNSTNFPMANAFQPTYGGFNDAFVTKYNPSGSALVYSTYLGGNDSDAGRGIAVDSAGNAYVTGETESTNFPTANALSPTLMGLGSSFVSEFNAAGSGLVYSTYLGGSSSGGDSGSGIAVDSFGDVYVIGSASSTNLPTVNALQPNFAGGVRDAFVTKISPVSGTIPSPTFLVSSLNPASFGQAVTFTATIIPQCVGTPTGTVTFQDGATVLGSVMLNVSAQASFSTSSLALGTHSIVAVYGGDSNFPTSTSAALTEDVSVLHTITVSPTSASVPALQTRQFTAMGFYADGTNGNVTTSVTWLSSNSAIATLSNAVGSQGLATGVAQGGPVTITALSGAVSGTAPLTVTAPPQPPTVVSLTPNSGTAVTQTFSVVVSNLSGAGGLNNLQLLFNPTQTRLSACNVSYDAYTSTLSLYDDTGTGFAGALSLGSPARVSNSQCQLSGTGSSYSASGNTATLSVALLFLGTFAGQKNAYVYVQGNNGSNNGWALEGTWAVPGQLPTVMSLSPNSGAGLTQKFTVVVSDPNGPADLNNIELLFNNTANRLSGCDVNYDAHNNTLLLDDDLGTTYLPPAVPIGSTAQVSNSQCRLIGTGSSYTTSGNTMTLSVTLTFFWAGFAGLKNAYVNVRDIDGLDNGGWMQEGTWMVPVTPNVVSLTPSSGMGLTQTFTVEVYDPQGTADLNNIQLLFNAIPYRFNGCDVSYDVYTNTISLYNNSGTGFAGALTPGSSAQLSNSQCTLSGTGSSYSTSGNTATLNVALTFSTSFGGQRYSYAYTQGNDVANYGGWALEGTWTPVPEPGPTVVSLSPSGSAAITQTFSVVVNDPSGSADLNNIQLLFNDTPSRANGCDVSYDVSTNTISLYDGSGNGFVGELTPGSSTQLSNNLCTLDGTGSLYSISGNTATLTVALTSSILFNRNHGAYVYVQGNNGLNTGGWVLEGIWAPGALPPTVVSVTPNSGTGTTQTFSVVVNDPNTYADVNNIQLLFNTTASRLSACNVSYDVFSNTISLYNDGSTGFVGGVTPGSSAQVSNTQCTLSGTGSSFSLSSSKLTVALTFSATFTGPQNAYVYVQGNDGLNNGGWQLIGSWTP